MKLATIFTLSSTLVFTLSGCSSEPTTKFAQLDQETSDYCSKFNGVNKSGKKITVTSYTIKTTVTENSGKKVEKSKIVECGT